MDRGSNGGLTLTLLAAAIGWVLLSAGVKSHQDLSQRAVEQTSATNSIARWKESYRELEGAIEEWDKTYKKASSVRDQLSLSELLNLEAYQLQADTDSVVIFKDDQVVSNNTMIGLTKLCLGTTGEKFEIKAASYDALINGITELAKRKDLFIGEITVIGDKAVPQTRLGSLCVYLRNE